MAREDMLTPADDYTVRDWKQNYYAAAAFSDDLFGQLLVSLGAVQLAAVASLSPLPLGSNPV